MALESINEIITDPYILREGYIYRDGFVFTKGQSNPVIFDRLVIRTPMRAQATAINLGYSYRTLEEHILLINELQIKKAIIICDDLNFIHNCSSLKDIIVCLSFEAMPEFDYSPLYNINNLQCVDCQTVYGDGDKYQTTIDYSRINMIEGIVMTGDGHLNFNTIPALRTIWLSGNKKIKHFNDVSQSTELQKATIWLSSIRSLDGIELLPNLESLSLYRNSSLSDISKLSGTASTLRSLAIESCSKIQNFSVLQSLINLEHLQLNGNNTLPDLSFLQRMPKLKTFVFTMNVLDGNLSNCMHIPYVSCKNRRHYNLKDSQLPKN